MCNCTSEVRRFASPRNDSVPSIQVEFLELAVLGLDVAHRAGDRAHHHGLGLDHVLAELDARQQRTVVTPVAANRQSPFAMSSMP